MAYPHRWATLVFGWFVSSAAGQAGHLPAFPGAEGFGSTTPGGRGGQVCFVTTLADSGRGSFRDACATAGPRVIVFRTGGTITLREPIILTEPFITIAGQSASGDGICLRTDPGNDYAPLIVRTHDVVIRYLRIRPGPPRSASPCKDALAIEKGAADVIIDHCSLSWATDETLQLWGNPRDITVQWCFITEALHRSTHPDGPHSKGVLISSEGCKNVSLHHNLLAHNMDRNPRIGTSGLVDFVNNVIYNPDAIGQMTDGHGRQRLNYVGNYVRRGPDSKTEPPTPKWSRYELFAREVTDNGFSIYLKGNIGPHRLDGTGPEESVLDPRDHQYVVHKRHDAPSVTTLDARRALEVVLERAGAILPRRDAVDERIVREVISGTGRVIDHPSDVGGWPELATGNPPRDADTDGLPDSWELAHQLDPADPTDHRADPDGDGYTNIEEYLNATDPQRPEQAAVTRPPA